VAKHEFVVLIENPGSTYASIREYLNGLDHATRLTAIRAVGGRKKQARLWTLAEDALRLTIEEMVPRSQGNLAPVIFHGKNSLPIFTEFQKRFCRPGEDCDEDVLWGYNHQTMSALTGPGYFVAEDSDDDQGGVAINYYKTPPGKPDSWPKIPKRTGLVGHLVYGSMIDYLRPLSDHVSIGRAVRKGKITENYFILCREK
jgi:hypothetical protein